MADKLSAAQQTVIDRMAAGDALTRGVSSRHAYLGVGNTRRMVAFFNMNELQDRGLIERCDRIGQPFITWCLTDAGRALTTAQQTEVGMAENTDTITALEAAENRELWEAVRRGEVVVRDDEVPFPITFVSKSGVNRDKPSYYCEYTREDISTGSVYRKPDDVFTVHRLQPPADTPIVFDKVSTPVNWSIEIEPRRTIELPDGHPFAAVGENGWLFAGEDNCKYVLWRDGPFYYIGTQQRNHGDLDAFEAFVLAQPPADTPPADTPSGEPPAEAATIADAISRAAHDASWRRPLTTNEASFLIDELNDANAQVATLQAELETRAAILNLAVTAKKHLYPDELGNGWIDSIERLAKGAGEGKLWQEIAEERGIDARKWQAIAEEQTAANAQLAARAERAEAALEQVVRERYVDFGRSDAEIVDALQSIIRQMKVAGWTALNTLRGEPLADDSDGDAMAESK